MPETEERYWMAKLIEEDTEGHYENQVVKFKTPIKVHPENFLTRVFPQFYSVSEEDITHENDDSYLVDYKGSASNIYVKLQISEVCFGTYDELPTWIMELKGEEQCLNI